MRRGAGAFSSLSRRGECALTFAVFFARKRSLREQPMQYGFYAPHAEQTEIVRKEESLLAKAAELENQITYCEQYTKLRLSGILKGAFEEK